MKLLFKNSVTIFVSLYLLILLCWDAILFLNPEKTTLFNYWFNAGYGLIYLFTGILGIIYAKRIGLSSVFGKAFTFIGGSLISYSIGQFIWLFYNLFSDVEVPYPSAADIFYLLFYVFIFIGFIFLLNTFKKSITKQMLYQLMIIVPIVFIFSLAFIFRPNLSSDLSFWEKTFNIIYPVSDTLFLCIILIMMRISGGYLKSTILFFAAASIMQLIGDFLFSYYTVNGTYWNGNIVDLVFMISSYLFLLSFVYFMQKMEEVS